MRSIQTRRRSIYHNALPTMYVCRWLLFLIPEPEPGSLHLLAPLCTFTLAVFSSGGIRGLVGACACACASTSAAPLTRKTKPSTTARRLHEEEDSPLMTPTLRASLGVRHVNDKLLSCFKRRLERQQIIDFPAHDTQADTIPPNMTRRTLFSSCCISTGGPCRCQSCRGLLAASQEGRVKTRRPGKGCKVNLCR